MKRLLIPAAVGIVGLLLFRSPRADTPEKSDGIVVLPAPASVTSPEPLCSPVPHQRLEAALEDLRQYQAQLDDEVAAIAERLDDSPAEPPGGDPSLLHRDHLADRMQAEARDEAWAVEAERSINALAMDLALPTGEVRCATSLCTITLAPEPGADLLAMAGVLDRMHPWDGQTFFRLEGEGQRRAEVFVARQGHELVLPL